MKNLLAAALLAWALLAPAVQANPPATPRTGTALDIVNAGELRLQSQRLAKLWLQAGLGIHADTAGRQLAAGMVRVERSLAALSHYAQQATAQRQLQRSQALWAEYRTALRSPFNPANLETVNRLADELMLATGRLSQRIEAESDGPAGRLLDLSLRQNMLAQRLARLTLAAQAGDRSRGRLVDIEQARKEFATTLGELLAARENPPAVGDALELARLQWLFFDRAISELGRRDSLPEHVATTSERISEVLDDVSRQYAGALDGTWLAAAGQPPRRN